MLYFGAKGGRFDLRAIPTSLALGLILSSFRPWGATAVSIRSQLNQFRQRLGAQHVLENGRLKLDPLRLVTFAKLTATDDRLRSTLNNLEDLGALDQIAPVFTDLPDNPFGKPLSQDLGALLGINWANDEAPKKGAKPSPPPVDQLPPPTALSLGIRGYDRLVGPIWVNKGGGIQIGAAGSAITATAKIEGLRILFGSDLSVGSGASVTSFNLVAVMRPRVELPQSPIVVPPIEGRGLIILVKPAEVINKSADAFEAWLLLNTES